MIKSNPRRIRRYFLFLLIVSALLAVAGYYPDFEPPNIPAVQPEHDHGDPEKQRRMGIYHYNEGNKLLRERKWEEAVDNYKMALHHDPELFEASVNLSTAYLQGKKLDPAHTILTTLQKKNPGNPLVFYNLACYYALKVQIGPSLEALRKAVTLGYKDFQAIQTDPDLENLRKDPKFAAWIKTLK